MIRPDDEVLRAALVAMEAEAAFGIREIEPGPALPVVSEAISVVDEPAPPTVVVPGEAPVPLATEDSTLSPTGGAAATGSVASEKPAAPRDEATTLEGLAAAIAECRACSLCETRTRTVPGQGAPRARLMFVGEAPGYNEDREGLAFVGKAGQLLTKMIGAMGLDREQIFIANVLKCRPPENRDPRPEEVDACFHFLLSQIDAVSPEVVCTLGGHATNNLLDRSEAMSRLRGRVFDFEGRKLVPTYHPSYLLRNPSAKRAAWQDLQVVMKLLGLPLS